ncbi:hypothetical protein CPB97_002003 [Podila verticillata]|nr:hypothetical protein CPB97_002003 [Podila verticillata]
MFDIPELNEMVLLLLDQISLARCAQVSKEWNNVAGPHVWRVVPILARRGEQLFRQLVLEDYIQKQHRLEQQHQRRDQPPAKKARKSAQVVKSANETLEPTKTHPPLALAKYGHLVRQVEDFAQLLLHLEPTRMDGSEKHTGPSAPDLARHFFNRCPHALLAYEITYDHVKSASLFPLALEVLPRVNTLIVKGSSDHRQLFPETKFKQILGATSKHLYSLTIHVIEFREAKREDCLDPPAMSMTARPKHLKLHAVGKTGHSGASWSWLWRACGQVEKIEIFWLWRDVIESLVQGIRNLMPCVNTVVLGRDSPACGRYSIPDYSLGTLLAAGTKGWKTVDCGARANVGPYSIAALLQHASTLEELSVVQSHFTTGIIRVLKSCPRLRKLVTIDNECYNNGLFPVVIASELIDWNPEVEAIRPWLCKATLETLALKIHVPEQGTPANGGHLVDDPQHVLATQQRVCERLGEFTNLRILQLGHQAQVNQLLRKGGFRAVTIPRQGKCLSLTLETGLEMLCGLKTLEELHIPNMDHLVAEGQEVEWMVEHWPRLSVLTGLDEDSEAYKWIEANRPHIRLE